VTPQQGSSAESSEEDEAAAAGSGTAGTAALQTTAARRTVQLQTGIDHSKLKALGRRVAAGPGGRRMAAAVARRAVGESAGKKEDTSALSCEEKEGVQSSNGVAVVQLTD